MFSSVGMGFLHRHNMSLWKILLLSLDFVFVTSKKKGGWTGLNMRWILTKSGRKGNNNFNWTPQQNLYSGDIPQDFIKALCLFQSLKSPKTWNVTISLISHAAKIVLKVIKKRITPLIEKKISENQLGFRKGKDRPCWEWCAIAPPRLDTCLPLLRSAFLFDFYLTGNSANILICLKGLSSQKLQLHFIGANLKESNQLITNLLFVF